MSEDVARLQEGIDAARKTFGAEREGLLQREGGRVLNIQGQEFALRGERPEAVPLEKVQPERELSMTELLRRDKGIAPAEPSPAPVHEQTRSR